MEQKPAIVSFFSHYIKTSLENTAPCFQELGPWWHFYFLGSKSGTFISQMRDFFIFYRGRKKIHLIG